MGFPIVTISHFVKKDSNHMEQHTKLKRSHLEASVFCLDLEYFCSKFTLSLFSMEEENVFHLASFWLNCCQSNCYLNWHFLFLISSSIFLRTFNEKITCLLSHLTLCMLGIFFKYLFLSKVSKNSLFPPIFFC